LDFGLIAFINKRSGRELIQLLECLAYTLCNPTGNGAVKSFLRRMQVGASEPARSRQMMDLDVMSFPGMSYWLEVAYFGLIGLPMAIIVGHFFGRFM
jgi:hypothetical protein